MEEKFITLCLQYQRELKEKNEVSSLKELHQTSADLLYEIGQPKNQEQFTDEDKKAFQQLYLRQATVISTIAFGYLDGLEDDMRKEIATNLQAVKDAFEHFKLPSVLKKEAAEKKRKEEEKKKKAAERAKKRKEKAEKEKAEKELAAKMASSENEAVITEKLPEILTK